LEVIRDKRLSIDDMKFEDLKPLVEKKFPGWRLVSDPDHSALVFRHIEHSSKKIYSHHELLITDLQILIEDMQKFCNEAVKETVQNHLKEFSECAHAEVESRIELINGEILHLVLCSNCGSVIFPKYIPGHLVPLAKPGKPVSIGSLSIANQFGNDLPHSTKANTVTLKKAPHSGDSISIKYKIDKGEMLIQNGSKWLPAEKVGQLKKKSKKIEIKPGQRKVKFEPS